MRKRPKSAPPYVLPAYLRVPPALNAKTAWKCWCDYKYTDKLLDDILDKYGISVPTLYKTGRRFGDKFRRGRGKREPYPLSESRMEKLWQEYAEGALTISELEEKYGIGIQWVYKYANEFKRGKRRRPDRTPRLQKKALTPSQEKAAWRDYEKSRLTVSRILEKYGIDNSTLYDIGDRLGSTFRRHPRISVTRRVRYRRNMRGVDYEDA